jgi:hypothetical protein
LRTTPAGCNIDAHRRWTRTWCDQRGIRRTVAQTRPGHCVRPTNMFVQAPPDPDIFVLARPYDANPSGAARRQPFSSR